MTPRIVRALVIVALQKYFINHTEYPWQSDRSKTSIFIQADYAEDTREHNVNPMIVVESTGISFSSDSTGGNLAHLDRYKEAYVEEYFQFLANGGLNIHCIAEGDDAAEELGFEVAMFITSLKPTLADILQIQYLSMPSQSKPQVVRRDDWQGEYDCIVSFNYAFAIKQRHIPIDKGELLADILFYLDPSNITLQEGTGELGGTSTGGQNGNWGGTGGINPAEGTDGVDDGTVTLQISVANGSVVVDEG